MYLLSQPIHVQNICLNKSHNIHVVSSFSTVELEAQAVDNTKQ